MNDNHPQQRRRYVLSQTETVHQQPSQPVHPAGQASPAQENTQHSYACHQPLTYSKGSLYSPRYYEGAARLEPEQQPTELPHLPKDHAQAYAQKPVQQPQPNSLQQQPERVHADASYCPASGHYVPPEARDKKLQKSLQHARREKAAQAPLQRMLLVVCAVVFAVSAFLLIRYFANILITRRASAQLEAVYSASLENADIPTDIPSDMPTPTVAPTSTPAVAPEAQPAAVAVMQATEAPKELWPSRYPQNPMLRVSSVFYELQRQNPDIIGWLKIDGVLEEAVVQRDNDYYLTHNALKQKSVTGALFLDETCDLKTVPSQMVIHGHNMKEGAMFGSLKKYKVKDASFYRAHPYIEFNTIYENSRFVIFAVAEVDLRWNKGNYLPFWQDVRFHSADAFMEYVKKARDLSHYRCNVDVVPGDRLLTLSTCTGTDDNQRLIVMARRIRDDENLTQLNMSILSTGDR